MARLVTTFKPLFKYVTDRSVGRNASNDRADVLLVQFMLRVATSGLRWPKSPPPAFGLPGRQRAILQYGPLSNSPVGTIQFLTGPPDGIPIVIDGICGQQTISFIERFQQDMKDRQFGVEDTVGQMAPYSTTVSTVRTSVGLLNEVLQMATLQGLLATINDLSKHYAFPRELYYIFYTGQT